MYGRNTTFSVVMCCNVMCCSFLRIFQAGRMDSVFPSLRFVTSFRHNSFCHNTTRHDTTVVSYHSDNVSKNHYLSPQRITSILSLVRSVPTCAVSVSVPCLFMRYFARNTCLRMRDFARNVQGIQAGNTPSRSAYLHLPNQRVARMAYRSRHYSVIIRVRNGGRFKRF